MKVVILAGGLGTRIRDESGDKPKPMVRIGEKPILWHIMKIYSHYGFNEFIICLGYKSYYIKEYFSHYLLHQSDVTIDFSTNSQIIHNCYAEAWVVTLVDTGLTSMTGGRLKRIKPFVGNETFMVTYGDGLSDIDINKLLDFHKSHGKLVTITAAKPDGRFGTMMLAGDGVVKSFEEKTRSHLPWINIGFFIMEPEVFDYIEGDETIFEKETMARLLQDKQLVAYKHTGFWHPMDTALDRDNILGLWKSGKAPWKVWE